VFAQELLTAFLQDGVVAVSENTRSDNPFVRQVVPHGVDERVFHPAPERRTKEPSILFVGSLDGRKRGRFLLDGFVQHVQERHPDATLTIVGDGVAAYRGVTCLTGVTDAQLARLYQRSWVYASPSTYEGFGLPYLEAMACGTPVVATANSGSLEVLDRGRYGLLPTEEEFITTVTSLLSDDARRVALAAAGITRASEYSLTRMLDGYEQVLLDLLNVRRKPDTTTNVRSVRL
jgi:glycosyltransferase involved in cell wall biosynthesis